ncbi:MAG TPA: DNA-binding protein [Desulfobacterales bacterium]|nr:MAG: DNA-binding protein [Deltaproteobacteria bacterium]HHC25010.1 DNA-binding protein [Desulfobacterales bacterium]
MKVDSKVILEVFENEPNRADRSESVLHRHSITHIEELEEAIAGCEFEIKQKLREALLLAGKAYLENRRQRGNKLTPLPDFYIGAHALVTGMELMTRDTSRFRSYFPSERQITPEQT